MWMAIPMQKNIAADIVQQSPGGHGIPQAGTNVFGQHPAAKEDPRQSQEHQEVEDQPEIALPTERPPVPPAMGEDMGQKQKDGQRPYELMDAHAKGMGAHGKKESCEHAYMEQ